MIKDFLSIILIFSFFGCSYLEKKEQYKRISIEDRKATEFFLKGEENRRKKLYEISLKNFYKAVKIYNKKFDYQKEFQTMLKIGFIFTKTKNEIGFNNVISRLELIKNKINNGNNHIQFLYSLFYIENKEFNKADKILNELSIDSKNSLLDRSYYLALRLKLSGHKDTKIAELLKNNWKIAKLSFADVNNLESPESILFINKTLAIISLNDNNIKDFNISIDNCEKIINFYEFTEFSNSIIDLKQRILK